MCNQGLAGYKVFGGSDDLANMEYRRREPRFEIDQPVTITDLEQPDILMHGHLANFSAKGIRLTLQLFLKPGTMVKVEWGGTILLGEIMYCTPQGAEFAAGLELEDALYETETLAYMSDMGAPQVSSKR